MIKYGQTTNNSEIEIPEIKGYKKQFPINILWGEESTPTPEQQQGSIVEVPKQQETPQQVETPQQEDFTEEEKNILLNDGSAKDKSKIANKYLQKNLGLTKEQAAALVGVWTAESNFNLNAENKAEKAGKNKYVKASEYGIGIGQWTGKRHNDYVNYINTNGGKNNLKTQLDFAIQEIKNKYSDYLNNLKSATSVKDATAYTYAQYVAANERNIKDTNDLYSRVDKIVQRYNKAHKNIYGKSSLNGFERRLKYAENSLLAKMGIKLP